MKQARFFFSAFVAIVLSALSCQKATVLEISGPTSFSFTCEGGSKSVSFTTNKNWSVSSSESWCKVTTSSGSEAEGPVSVTISCDANQSYDTRTCTVTIKAEELTQSISVSQDTNLGILVTPSSFDVTSSKQTIEIVVQANVSYSVSISAEWIQQVSTKGLTSNSIVFNIDENTTFSSREASISVKSQDKTVLDKVIVVRQSQNDALNVKDSEFNVSYHGGEIEVAVEANIEFSVIPDVEWIHYVQTKVLSSSTICLTVDENTSAASREGHIKISQNNGTLSYSVLVNQTGKVPVSSVTLDKSEVLLLVGQQEVLSATIIPDNATEQTISWVSDNPEVVSVDNGSITAIAEGEARITATVDYRTATCSVRVLNPEKALVLEVRATVSNSYTAYLPITTGISDDDDRWNNAKIYGIVDWGDNVVENFTGTKIPYLVHTYPNENRTYIVKVYAYHIYLSANRIGKNDRDAIVKVVQWGDPGIYIISGGFEGYTSLVSVPADKQGAFKNLRCVLNGFKDCTSLTTIEPGIFQYCDNVTQIESLFEGCTSLESIPEGLFSNCSSAPSFNQVFANCTNLKTVPASTFNNCHSATSFNRAFMRCSSLEELPSNLFASCENATDFNSVFWGCASLTALPSKLFFGCAKATTFDKAFSGCWRIVTLPEDLFKYCPNVETFYATFEQCQSLGGIPEKLFENNTKVTSFSYLFSNGKIAEAIPSSLFANCPEVSTFDHAFYYCGIKDIPVDLFDNNRRVVNFSATFCGLYGEATSESPYTIIDGVKYHLYERHINPDEFKNPEQHASCFHGNRWTDFDSMPSDWKIY